MAGLTFDTGNCPPGYYRPGIFNDCRPGTPPVIEPQPVYYAPEGGTPPYEPRSTQSAAINASYTQSAPYQQPMMSAPVASGGGGLSSTMLILIAVAAVVLMKK